MRCGDLIRSGVVSMVHCSISSTSGRQISIPPSMDLIKIPSGCYNASLGRVEMPEFDAVTLQSVSWVFSLAFRLGIYQISFVPPSRQGKELTCNFRVASWGGLPVPEHLGPTKSSPSSSRGLSQISFQAPSSRSDFCCPSSAAAHTSLSSCPPAVLRDPL